MNTEQSGVPPDTGAREQMEWEMDRLVALVGRVEALRADSPAYGEERFLEWLAKDAAQDPSTADMWPEERIVEVAELVRRRVWASRFEVPCMAGSPEPHYPQVIGPPSLVREGRAPRRAVPLPDFRIAAGAGRELWDEPCEQWIALPEGVPVGEYVALTVSGDSMQPAMHAGDVVLVRLGAEPSPGAVVVAQRPQDGYVVKGVGRLSHSEIELLSVNPAFEPITVPRTRQAILGTVLFRWCSHAEEPSTPR